MMRTMPFRVELSDPQLVAELRERMALLGDCLVGDASDGGFLVVHRRADSSAEARQELTFFLRAWEARHPGVQVALN